MRERSPCLFCLARQRPSPRNTLSPPVPAALLLAPLCWRHVLFVPPYRPKLPSPSTPAPAPRHPRTSLTTCRSNACPRSLFLRPLPWTCGCSSSVLAVAVAPIRNSEEKNCCEREGKCLSRRAPGRGVSGHCRAHARAVAGHWILAPTARRVVGSWLLGGWRVVGLGQEKTHFKTVWQVKLSEAREAREVAACAATVMARSPTRSAAVLLGVAALLLASGAAVVHAFTTPEAGEREARADRGQRT